MSRNIVDLLKSFPAVDLKSLVDVCLRRRGELERTFRDAFNDAIDRTVGIDGFRRPHTAPHSKLWPLVVGACIDKRWPTLAQGVTLAWTELHPKEAAEARGLVRAAGLLAMESGALAKALGDWAPGELGQLAANLGARRSSLTPQQAAFLICLQAARFADLAALEPLPAPTPDVAGSERPLAPIWQRTVDEARALASGAAEWETLDACVAALQALRTAKAEGARAAAAVAAAEGLLAEALEGLERVPDSVSKFFDVAGTLRDWKDPATAWTDRAAAAKSIERVAEILAEAEQLTKPPSSMAERRRQAAPLEAAEQALAEGLAAVVALRGASPAPTPPSECDQARSADPEPFVVALREQPNAASAAKGSVECVPPAAPAVAEADDLSQPRAELPAPAIQVPEEAPATSAGTPRAEQPLVPEPPLVLSALASQVPAQEAGEVQPKPYTLGAPAVSDLPPHLRSHGEYAGSHWISPAGRCEAVPWKGEGFADTLTKAAAQALVPNRLAELWIFARALGELNAAPASASSTVRAIAEILAQPSSPTSGAYPDRSTSLREVLPEASLWRRLELFLEAVRPSRETPITFERARELVEAAAFRDTPLRNAILALLKLGSMGHDPATRLREALATKAATATATPARLDELRAEFHRKVVAHWNAAGAKLPRKHCRDAWTRFIEQVEQTLRTLFPVAKGGREQWDVQEMRRSIGALVRIHDEVADHAEARFDDRTKMDRAARLIADLAMGVNEAAEALQHQGHANGKDTLPLDALRALLAARKLDETDEELCRQTLVAVATNQSAGPMPGLSLGLLLTRPDLLSALHGIGLEPGASAEAVVAGLDAIAEPLRAAAILTSPAELPSGDGTPPSRQLMRLLMAPHRRWLMSRLGPNGGAMMPKTARLDDEVAVFEEIDALKASWNVLDELASRGRDQVRGVLLEARQLAEQPPRDFDPVLCQTWLRQVRLFADHCKAALLEHLRARATSEQKGTALQALHEGRLGDAMHLLLEGPRESTSELAVRETVWRREAKARYATPLAAIAAEPGELFEAWRRGITGAAVGADRQLRTRFVEQVIEGAEKRWNLSKEHVIPAGELRRLLKPYNPTHLPQLSKFANLCVLAAPTNPKQSNFEHATAAVVDKLGKGNLYAVLAPLVSEAGRQAALKEFRRRGLAAAIIDDLDLCRILNLGGRRPSGLVALLEVVLEQQPWSAHFTPFAMHDGQHVQMEMYVGRSMEAGLLTQTSVFSRLFSGRKLGKSALLRYVHDTRDGVALPSGNTLRVIFVPAVGAESDLDIIDRFAEQLSEQLGFKVDGLDLEGNPGDALVQVAKRFVEERPTESLLVVFDEADKFVEAQLEAYDREQEACLSFRMRTQVESFRDAAMLPRIRFVFAGYRTTSTSEGAWANWGDVLRLKPLLLDEGARLIAGPLARMGIDASGQATTIAHRCGCQPVVLLRFGELLLKHLESRYGPSQRDHVVVTASDVAAVFNEEPVREEIRVVVRNNFQDSPRARVVFSALLGEFAQRAPGDGIPEADRLVIERLRAIDGDLAWLHAAPEAQVLEVQRLLKDFAARELVLMRRGPDGQLACHLRFPHHLAILLPEDPEGAIRADIAALRRRGAGVATEAPRALVTPRELDLLREATCRTPDKHFRIEAAVVGSHWFEAASHRSGGFPDRLGIPPDACYTATKADRGLDRERLAVLGGAPDALQRIASRRPRERPAPLLIGGADVLRWAYTRQLESDQMLEIVGLGRLGGPTLDWWFTKVRALSFEQLDWRERILKSTNGVPLLLAHLERELLGTSEGGVEIGKDKLEQALAATSSAEPQLVASLAGKEPATALSGREQELVRMLAYVGATTEYRAPRPVEDLTEFWDELYRPTLELPPIDPTSRADRVAASVLVALGIAPSGAVEKDEDPLRRLSVPGKDDWLYRLAASLKS